MSNPVSKVLNMPVQVVFNVFKDKNIYRCNRVEGEDLVTPRINTTSGVLKISLIPNDDSVKVVSMQHFTKSCYLFVVERTTGFIFKNKEQLNVVLYVDGLTNPQTKSTQIKSQPSSKRQYEEKTPSMINPILSTFLIADGIANNNFAEAYTGGLIMGSGLFD